MDFVLELHPYKQLASIVDSTKKNPTVTRKVKPLRPSKDRGNLVQGTIRAAFDNLATGQPKRKMSPGKAADTDMDNKLAVVIKMTVINTHMTAIWN